MKNKVEHYENRCSGKGTMHIEHLLQSKEMGSDVKVCAKVTIDVNASPGVHQHIGDGESYYILQDRVLYDDSGIRRGLQPGDVTFTPDQGFHGIENIGDEPLVFIALIIKVQKADSLLF